MVFAPHKMTDWTPKVVVFDLLTALLDSETVWINSTPSKSAIDARLWHNKFIELTSSTQKYKPYESLLTRAALDAGLPESSATNLVKNWIQLKPWPEVPPTLMALREAGYDLAIIVNCSTNLAYRAIESCCQTIKAETGCEFMFHAVVTAEESGFYKPHPSPLEELLAKTGWDADDALFVAGSPDDVVGASAVGMKVVWHNRAGVEQKAGDKPWKQSRTLDGALRGMVQV